MTGASRRRSGLTWPRASGSPTAARPSCSGTRSRSTARSSAARPTARTAIARLDSDPATWHGHVRDAVLRRRMPYGWQQVPDWPDGSYFWMAAPAVAGDSVYVTGERISRTAGTAGGEYTARFTVGAGDTLTYRGITALTGPPGGTQWGAAAPDPGR